jgi:uncharacterized protein with ParB-like and HNH nuclease domain
MEYKDWTISDCIKKVNDSLFLPDIQRPYVWSEDDIYLLFDSICRDYPINTVLFWFLEKNTLEEVAFIKRIKFLDQRFDENYPDTGALTRDHYFLAIDGQQRITSLFLTLKGTYKIKQRRNVINADLYFNFLSGVEENDKEILYEFQFFPQSKPDVWVETIEDKKKQRPSYSKNWIRVKYIYSLGVLHEVQTKVKEKIRQQIGVDISDPAFGSIFKLWSKLNFDKLITYYEEKTQDYDKVLDIFIRTNSGGQKLSYSDLLFSFIKSRWNEARDKFNDLLKQLNEGTKFKYTHDVLLKSILFIHAHDQEGLKYRTSNFTDKILNDTELEWDSKIVTAIKLTKDLLSSRFMLTHDKLITSYNAIVPITYYIYKYDLKGIGEEPNKITSELQSQIRQWLITSMLTGVFGGQSDGILHRAKKAIDENGGPGYFPVRELFEKFNDFKPSLNLAITKDLVRSFSYNSTESYLILSLLYNNSVNFNPLTDENLPQQDHIISQSELKRARISKEKINSIYNIRYVTASDNRMKSDESFVDWSSRLGNHVLQNHFIPEGTWNSENFDEFLAKREALFLNQLVINV